MTTGAPPDPETLRARLEALRSARGFLLPHHGALAAGAPDLHAAYLKMYTELAVRPRHLEPLARESIWLAVLVVAREAVGTHHLELFRSAGGSVEAAEALIAMAGFAAGHDAFRLADQHWSAQLPGLNADAAYGRGLARLGGDLVPEETAELAMLAAQAARHSSPGTSHHLHRAYALGIAEEKIVEALSYVIWPCGVNCFLDACTVWHRLLSSGAVRGSERFAVWAGFPGQGAWDAAGGDAPGGFDVTEEGLR